MQVKFLIVDRFSGCIPEHVHYEFSQLLNNVLRDYQPN